MTGVQTCALPILSIQEKFLSYDNEFPVGEGFILNTYFSMKKLALAEEKAFGLDSSETVVEKLPLVVAPATKINLQKVYYKVHHQGVKIQNK